MQSYKSICPHFLYFMVMKAGGLWIPSCCSKNYHQFSSLKQHRPITQTILKRRSPRWATRAAFYLKVPEENRFPCFFGHLLAACIPQSWHGTPLQLLLVVTFSQTPLPPFYKDPRTLLIAWDWIIQDNLPISGL